MTFSFIFLIACEESNKKTDKTEKTHSPVDTLKAAPIALVIHAGAGNMNPENMDSSKQEEIKKKLLSALNTGYYILENGGSSLDAVEACIRYLEDSPYFNAGLGAVFTNDGRNELDASIMYGKNATAGAVAGVRRIKNPIAAARAVMEQSEHVMLIGKGAEKFAKEKGIQLVDTNYFRTDENYIKWLESHQSSRSTSQNESDAQMEDKFGTVGCVALDLNGNLAAGTSTGGMSNKKYGRVGDSPIIGAGTYADNSTCGVSATGHGEYFIRNVVAYDIAALMKYKKLSVKDAAEEVVMRKMIENRGKGGVIAMDAKGNIAMPFNTSGMYRAYIKEKDKPYVAIFKDEL